MTSNNTTFINNETVIMADWLNDVNDTVYNVLGDGYFSPVDAAGVRTNIQVPKNDGTGASGTWPISITGNSNSINGVLPVAKGGTGASTANDALNTLLPAQTSQTGKYLTTDGTNASWASVSTPLAVPSGAVFYFAAATAPTGYLECNGAAISRTTYSDLFAIVGTTFGAGNGTTTFNLPDLRGQFIRGYDDSRGLDPARVFGSNQSSEFQSHSHTANVNDPGHSHGRGYTASFGLPQGSVVTGGDQTATSTATTGITVDIYNTGGTETRPTNVALLPCIKT